MKIGILLVMGGAAVTSTSVVLAGRFPKRTAVGFTESEKRLRPLDLVSKCASSAKP